MLLMTYINSLIACNTMIIHQNIHILKDMISTKNINLEVRCVLINMVLLSQIKIWHIFHIE